MCLSVLHAQTASFERCASRQGLKELNPEDRARLIIRDVSGSIS